MILKTVISQSNFEDNIFQDEPVTDWGAALDGNYSTLSNTKTTIFIPTTTDVNTYNHHIQGKQYYNDDIHVMFTTHRNAERGYGSRIRYSKSEDNGATWSTPIELLESQDTETKDYTTLSGRQSIACGFAVYNSELYAIIDINDLTANAATRTGVGVLAVKINNNSTFGTPTWIDTPQSDFIAPAAIATFTSYSFDTSLRTNLRDYMVNNQYKNNLISYFSTSIYDPLYVRLDFGGDTLSEPTVAQLPTGQYLKLWKDGDTSSADYKVGQTSKNQITWNSPYITAIPDINARTRILKLNNEEVALVGNNQHATAIRDPLFFALSNDGLTYLNGNTYNIDVTTYPAQFSGQGKGQGAQHPSLFELNNGQICVCYDWNKEEVYSAVFNKPTLV